jgi:pimeloyl-ACP methyl ester carboxylesterase
MLQYRSFGEGKTLVFLHGFLESSTMWDYLPLEELNAHCILIDLPGHGESPLNDTSEIPSIRFMADEVSRVLQREKVEEFSIIGHSLGAYVGLELAQLSGCQKLILLNSNCWTDDEQKRRDRLRVAELVFKAKNHFIREAIPNLFGRPADFQNEIASLIEEANLMQPESIAYAALAMRERKDFTADVIANPTKYIFIHGDLDSLVATEVLKSRVPAVPIHVIEHAGHMVHIEATEELVKKIIAEEF